MLHHRLLEWLDGWTDDEKDGKMHTEKKEDLTTPLKKKGDRALVLELDSVGSNLCDFGHVAYEFVGSCV